MLLWSRCAQPHADRESGSSADVLECAEVQHFFILFYLIFLLSGVEILFFIPVQPERANKGDENAQVYTAYVHVQMGNLDGAFLCILAITPPLPPPPITHPVMCETETKYPAADQTPAALLILKTSLHPPTLTSPVCPASQLSRAHGAHTRTPI